jgi:hypothetical protein
MDLPDKPKDAAKRSRKVAAKQKDQRDEAVRKAKAAVGMADAPTEPNSDIRQAVRKAKAAVGMADAPTEPDSDIRELLALARRSRRKKGK